MAKQQRQAGGAVVTAGVIAEGAEAEAREKYQQNVIVQGEEPRCPNQGCRSMDREILHSREFPDRPVYLRDGTLHRGQVTSRRRCLKCGRRYVVVTPLVAKG